VFTVYVEFKRKGDRQDKNGQIIVCKIKCWVIQISQHIRQYNQMWQNIFEAYFKSILTMLISSQYKYIGLMLFT